MPSTANRDLHAPHLVDLLELNLEDEIRVWGDKTGEALVAVRKVAGDVETCLLAQLHLHDALVPACRVPLAVSM
jgi:hypothetical protein